jgi:hypothetical protein
MCAAYGQLRIPVTALDAIAASCTQLLSLFVYAQVVGDAESALVGIARRNPMLSRVHLRGEIAGVTDAVLYALAEHCADLRHVELISAKIVTDASVVALARARPRMDALYLPHCTLLTDRSILALAEHCAVLRHLDVSYCTMIHTPALKQLLRGCPELFTVKVSSASITEAAVRFEKKVMRGYRYVFITRVDTPLPTWMCAMTSGVMRALFRRRTAASVVPMKDLDGICV